MGHHLDLLPIQARASSIPRGAYSERSPVDHRRVELLDLLAAAVGVWCRRPTRDALDAIERAYDELQRHDGTLTLPGVR